MDERMAVLMVDLSDAPMVIVQAVLKAVMKVATMVVDSAARWGDQMGALRVVLTVDWMDYTMVSQMVATMVGKMAGEKVVDSAVWLAVKTVE